MRTALMAARSVPPCVDWTMEIINIDQWIEENKASFIPPVCNKLMYGAGQLKVMFIGGPNIRKDYHIEEGEEFFYMLKGPMCLKVVEQNAHRDIPIAEGEVYLHPSRIPHSPQRGQDTVGLVIERERSQDEKDGLRYYMDGTVEPLWEEWFYCYDLGVQLGPVIKSYFASDEHKNGRPPPGKVFPPPPVNIDITTTSNPPFNLHQWITDNEAEIKEKGSKQLFGSGEFKVTVWGGDVIQEGGGEGETFLWQLKGSAEVSSRGESGMLSGHSCTLIKDGDKFKVHRKPGSLGITVTTDPLANK